MSQHKAQQGFLTFARNTNTVDYLHLAYVQALNVKQTQSVKNYAVVVDLHTNQQITEQHRKTFDQIIVTDINGPFEAECRAFYLTPWKETVKLEADLLFTRSIDHWWTAFRLQDVCLSHGCKDYQQRPSYTRKYRRVFDDNYLPDVYNGLMYFRYSQTAKNFFDLAQGIQSNWEAVKENLKGCDETYPSTDLLFALAANILGIERCSVPSLDFINFVHMKPAVNGYAETDSLDDVFLREFDRGMIRINGINQIHPVHYHEKDFITDTMVNYYAGS